MMRSPPVSDTVIGAAERAKKAADPLSAAAPSEGTKPKPKKKAGDDFAMVTPLTVDIDAEIRTALTYDELNEQIMSIRRALYHDLGVPFPGINLSLNPAMRDGKYRLLVNEVPVSEGVLKKGYVFALETADNLSATGISFESGKAFLTGYETNWVKVDDKNDLEETVGNTILSIKIHLCNQSRFSLITGCIAMPQQHNRREK